MPARLAQARNTQTPRKNTLSRPVVARSSLRFVQSKLTTASTRHVPRMSTVYAQTATMTSIWWALQQSDITYCCVRDRLHSLFAPGIFTDGSLMLNLSIFALLCTSFARHADAATCLKCACTLRRL